MRNAPAESEGAKHTMDFFEVGREYPGAMGLKMVAGRGFDASLESDYNGALLITERMAAITIGMNTDLPRYRAIDSPRKPSVFSPMRVAVDRLKFMVTAA